MKKSARKPKAKPDKWDQLMLKIQLYADASVFDSWKGGGDPASVPSIEATLVLAKAQLIEHITIMQREES